jgi:uncharacterized membrane protein
MPFYRQWHFRAGGKARPVVLYDNGTAGCFLIIAAIIIFVLVVNAVIWFGIGVEWLVHHNR